ncbi:complex I 51 kDa subunit family protein [Psychrilyobacter atlanticus]|uniref:complex I 51 kDa subunit family protein n=1 Tax=Psychrilyobacter atlanticus TaxID=271091 RepID=UPI0004220861|nr:NADH-ubiquinone oxidoreductase-F iron-sulfur binding region domain-containing protein [Psychrilyobacter atlanticus]
MVGTINNKFNIKMISENFGKYKYDEIDKYIELDGFSGLKVAFEKGKQHVIDELKISGLRGRGGAAFPTWQKWKGGLNELEQETFVICNADEGEPATFKDRELLSQDPYKVIEGLTISGYMRSAKTGTIYLREEYTYMKHQIEKAIELSRERGYLGKNILGTGFDFDIRVFSGAGAYVCGEGSALIESMEGKAGKPRLKAPRISSQGYLQMPTQSNNVESLAVAATILKMGASKYAEYGYGESVGTKLISICGNINKPAVYEIPFGITLREIIEEVAGGVENNKKVKFLQLGGVSGPLVPESLLDTRYTYEDLWDLDLGIGSGAILVADEDMSVIEYMKLANDFFHHESCGKCIPCREGVHAYKKIIDKLLNKTAKKSDIDYLLEIGTLMNETSFCGLGQTAATPVLKAIKYFKDELYTATID